jgi:hypothetical protein
LSAGHSSAVPSPRFAGLRLSNLGLGFVILLSGFVIFEPAPYEFALIGLMAVWAASSLTLSRSLLPLIVLMLLYAAGGALALTQAENFPKSLMALCVTAFLAASSIFYAAIISVEPQERLTVICRGYIAAAVVTSLIGILAYFNVLPNSEMFKLYARAKSTFQDPNVFGPFLILPLVLLVQHVLTHRIRQSLIELALSLVIFFAIFLSFSRAAWGLTVFAIVFCAIMAFVDEQTARGKARLLGYAVGGFVTIALLLAVALSFDAVSSLFAERAELVQDYDAGRYGRFERHIIGFFMVLEKPLGIGPYAFGLTLGEDEHNMLLKGFTVYGWLGGFSYFLLIGATLIVTTPLLRRRRPWQPVLIATYAVYLGHLMIHMVIDQDHWRHLFLIYGMLWGIVAAEKRVQIAERPRPSDRSFMAPVFAVPALPRSAKVVASHATG